MEDPEKWTRLEKSIGVISNRKLLTGMAETNSPTDVKPQI
jgi:hypothetical protein